MEYEELLEKAYRNNIHVVENYHFHSSRIKGLYCNSTIALNKDLQTTAEKKCILSEELGHHFTSSGNIIDLHNTENCKQEYAARLYAYEEQASLTKIIEAYEKGARSSSELAEELNVTEKFLAEALETYEAKYGVQTTVGNYIVNFIPNLKIFSK